MPEILVATHQVRSYEADSFGHANNAVFLNYLEYARGQYLLQKGLSFNDFHRWGKFPYVVNVKIAYKSPARIDDVLEIRGWISNVRRTRFALSYQVYNKTTNRISAVAEVTMAFVNQDKRPVAIPREFIAAFGIGGTSVLECSKP